MTIQTIVEDALRELGVLSAVQSASSEDATLALRLLNRIYDSWNARRVAAYVVLPTDKTLTGSLNPHTIGPSAATFAATLRPVAIESAGIVQSDVVTPLNIRDDAYFDALSDPTLEGTPEDLNYRAGWPNGSIYLYPVPSSALTLRLRLRTTFAAVALVDTFTLPPGYEEATVLTLAEKLAPSFGVALSPMSQTSIAAREARSVIFANNRPSMRIATAQAGMSEDVRSGFDYRTGRFV